ncbi:hypothetical protein A9O67_10805 [Tepidimonas fonticaldi]|uniref:MgtC/SapB/SrpB/YhiD N-terminal domain-containing protein n=1 Tax=Tepidimonas fonticaldi TaxID=1101373 RepID=A0A1A6DZE3_9BURK|nr:MgtC/SapB family protein [Tepidimonas fonticaldi]OBS32036.1 hypothetical protein A9O67_10805 [Tepidimonas fonticaldi]
MGAEHLTLWDRYWSQPVLQANLLVFANLLGALALGLLVGYERSYRGRAAGMRTYGIVCMASAALTALLMLWGGRIEARLPALSALAVTLTFQREAPPDEARLRAALSEWGFALADGSMQIHSDGAGSRWHFVMVAGRTDLTVSLPEVARRLRAIAGVESVDVAHARN